MFPPDEPPPHITGAQGLDELGGDSEPAKKKIKLHHWSELSNLPKRRYLIKGLIDQGGMSVLYGESNAGKTFVALDIACHIALGWPWQQEKTRKGSVVYIAAESGLGVAERLTAFMSHYGLKDYADLYLVLSNVCLCGEKNDATNLLKSLNHISDVKLVIIDTLARAMGAGNENSSEDMGAFIMACDHIREKSKAHVMVIHHSGKDTQKGARGHSSLKAAVDTEIKVSQENGIIVAEVLKQRDGRTGVKFGFQLKPIEVGFDEDGDTVVSCALINTEAPNKKKGLSGQAWQTYNMMADLMKEKGVSHTPKKGMNAQTCIRIDICKEHFKKAGISEADKPEDINRIFNRQKNTLKKQGYIAEWDGYLWFLDRQDK